MPPQGKAAAGEVHFSVSAMQRCLQTADPLLRRLGSDVRDVTVEPRLMEVPGMCGGGDRRWLNHVLGPLAASTDPTDGTAARARTVYNARAWAPCGLTKNEIIAKYSWARQFGVGFVDGEEDVGWHRGGFERPSQTDTRIAGQC